MENAVTIVFSEGVAARRVGLPVSAVPESLSVVAMRDSWVAGWRQADTEIRREWLRKAVSQLWVEPQER